VVDASGRRTQAARWLAALGTRPPTETARPCGFYYLTQHFRLRPGTEFPTDRVPLLSKLDYTKVVVFPGDNGCFQISMTVVADDPVRRLLREPGVFQRFLSAVPVAAPWVAAGEPLDEPRPMARLEDRCRSLDDGSGPSVAGYVLLADAAVQTNPAFGRGTSLAFAHAQHLARTAEQAPGAGPDFTRRFERWTAEHLGVWFQAQVDDSRQQLLELRAGVHGHTAPPAAGRLNRFVAALGRLSLHDEEAAALQRRFFNMLLTPRELLADPVTGPRVQALLDAGTDLHVPAAGPDRAAFERLVCQAAGPARSFVFT
jgi:hypothetical protein